MRSWPHWSLERRQSTAANRFPQRISIELQRRAGSHCRGQDVSRNSGGSVIVSHFAGPRHHPVRIGIEVPLDEVVHVDQRDQLPCLRPWREARRGIHEIRRQRRPLVVLNDVDDHRTGVSADHGAASALGVKEVLARLERFVRHSVEARPQVEAEVLATTRTDHVDVPETDPVDHTQPVVFGLGEHRVDSHPQPLGEVLEPGVGRGLQDDRVVCQEDAPGFVLVPVVPALLFRQLDRGGGAGGEGDLVDLAGSLDGEAVSAEGLVDWGDVLVDLGDGAEAESGRGRVRSSSRTSKGLTCMWRTCFRGAFGW